MVDNEGIKNLANAVILQACKDFEDNYMRFDCLVFFKSEWFNILARDAVASRAIIKYLEGKTYGKSKTNTKNNNSVIFTD